MRDVGDAVRHDTTAVIGSAVLARARGTGQRRIAAELDRPLSTVRRWVSAVRDPDHVEWLRRSARLPKRRYGQFADGGRRPWTTLVDKLLWTTAPVVHTPV